jgi:hypothetical protein
MLQFIAYNGFGNNLYIDNLTIGNRDSLDIAITAIKNIPKDTFYSPGLDTMTVFPEAKISNIGINSVNIPFHIIMEISDLNYTSDSTISSISSGQTLTIYFNEVRIPANTPIKIIVYSTLADSNIANDTLVQNSLMLKGAMRNILLEEWTSATSMSCANNNLFLDTFVNNNFSSICPVKYHLGFPEPGNDSMYLANPFTPDQRRVYYSINSLPSAIFDGSKYISPPYNNDSGLVIPYIKRLINGSPLSMNVTDIRLTGDTIQSTIDINILHNLKSGNYKLRVMTIERTVFYQDPPGNNGEKTFYDVFRNSLTDSNGVTINTSSGTYQYIYKYQRQQGWQDSMIYTLAFIQNDDTKEVLNCAKGRNNIVKILYTNQTNRPYYIKPDIIRNSFTSRNKFYNKSIHYDSVFGNFKYELFEGTFPPQGWNLINNDIGYTFTQVDLINGPSIGGTNSIQMPFYNYTAIGARDTLLSITFANVNSTDTLRFDYSYAQYLSTFVDSLIVNISIDGGVTYSNIFAEGGSTLATAASTTLPFAPTFASDWKTFSYPLSQVLPSNVDNIKPAEYELMQNYPNPFNPITKITYQLPIQGFVSLKVYDITGREIRIIINQQQAPGTKEIEFNGQDLSSGVYFYVLKVNDFRDVKKMVLVK